MSANLRPCPYCSAPLAERARFCGQCGKTLPSPSVAPSPPVAEPPRAAVNLGKTLVDPTPFGSDAAEGKPMPRPSPLAESVMASYSTHPPPAPAPEPAPAPMRAPAFAQKTMLGMPATDLPFPPPPASSKAMPPASAAPPPADDPRRAAPMNRTMLGVAMPGVAPTVPSHAPAPPPPSTQPAPAGPGNLNLKSKNATMIGVAASAVSPTRPDQAPHTAPLPPPVPIVPPPAPLVDEPLPSAPRIKKANGVPAIVVVLIVFGVVAAVGGVTAFFALRGNRTLTAHPELDESGHESLRLGCPTCPDGTTVTLGTSTTQMDKNAAVLLLPAPLSIGDNELTVKIDRHGKGRTEDVKIHVPVAYRVRADLSTLASTPRAITVRVEAQPGSEVKIDDKPVALDAQGRGAYAIDLAKETEGTSDEQKTFDRKIPFAITAKGGKVETGELTARTAIVPLHLDAPGLLLVTDKATAPISGQTRPNATIAIGGQPVAVDAQGRFGVRVELPASGEKALEIVASSPPMAPRTVHATVVRTDSLETSAKAFESEMPAAIQFDAFGADPGSKTGARAIVEGEVVEARVTASHTVLLIDERKTCPAKTQCLVRVLHGTDDAVARGDTVRAYGRVVGAVAADGKQVPDIDASIVMPLKKAAK